VAAAAAATFYDLNHPETAAVAAAADAGHPAACAAVAVGLVPGDSQVAMPEDQLEGRRLLCVLCALQSHRAWRHGWPV
jgi:hypothetical protein